MKLCESEKVRILVIEVKDEADGDQVLAVMIKKGAAAGAIVQWPSERVLHQTGVMSLRHDLPELFEADAEFLRLTVSVEAKASYQSFAEAAAGAFCKQMFLGAQLHAARETVLTVAILRNTHVTGSNACDSSVCIEQDLRR